MSTTCPASTDQTNLHLRTNKGLTPCAIPRYTIGLVREPTSPYSTAPQFQSAHDTFTYLQTLLKNEDREQMYGIFLDRKQRMIGLHHIAMGSLSEAIIHPREVFKCAILLNANAVILAHNHPSGDPKPSNEDRQITKRLAEAGQLLGIELLDHLVLGENRFYSFAEHGILLDL